jgi:predicted RND superfamily exporter protein
VTGLVRAGPRRGVVAGLVLAGTLGALAAVAPALQGLGRAVEIVPRDDPLVSLDREITAEFGFENPVVWLIEARRGSMWTRERLARVQALTREVLTVPGVIATDVVSLASPSLRDLRVTEAGLEPVYLMGEVPGTAAEVAALRARVEGDPKYAGTLVSADGRAAMIVANFRSGTDPVALGRAALDLRDRHRDADTAVWAVGGPVLRVLAPQGLRPAAQSLLVLVTATLLLLWWGAGSRGALAALLAGALANAWLVIGVAAMGAVTIPWTAYAIPPTGLVAAAVALAGPVRSWRGAAALVAGPLAGSGVLALVTGPPMSAFGVAGAVGSAGAVGAGVLVSTLLRPCLRPAPTPRLGVAVLALVAAAALGIPRLEVRFGLLGYGERYLPAATTEDLRALHRLFPPPSSLVVRARGRPGLAASPAALRAFDAVVTVARRDGAVRQALSLADVVKTVHRGFNDDRPEFSVVPGDGGLVARYLALAYSPTMRRFVDRAFTRMTLWVYVDGERPADLARVLAGLETQLAAEPVPDAEVDVAGGDGAVILVAARMARRLVAGGALMLGVIAVAAALGLGRAALGRTVVSGLVGGLTAAGAGAWGGLAIDLVTLPVQMGVVTAGAVVGAATVAGDAGALRRLALVLLGGGGLGLLLPLGVARLLGVVLLAPGAALALVASPTRVAVSGGVRSGTGPVASTLGRDYEEGGVPHG